MSSPDVAQRVRTRVWNGSIPLRIQLHPSDCATYDASTPYLIQFPRLSYLGLLLDRLHAFFARSLVYPDVPPTHLWFSYQGVPLRWHFPLGLLYDLYAGADPTHDGDDADKTTPRDGDDNNDDAGILPWTLTAHFSDYPPSLMRLDPQDKTLHDLFRNAVKEADYLRTGTAKTVMFLSEKDSTQLWDGVRTHNLALFAPVNAKLLNPQGAALRNLPLRLYLPHAKGSVDEEAEAPASLRVLQGLVPMKLGSRQPQTLGTALNTMLPSLFPSRRSPLLAQAILHGAVVPLGTDVDDLVRTAAYLDGWLHVVIVMMG